MENKELDERSQPIDNRSPVVLTRVFAVWLNYFIFDMCQILGICYYSQTSLKRASLIRGPLYIRVFFARTTTPTILEKIAILVWMYV